MFPVILIHFLNYYISCSAWVLVHIDFWFGPTGLYQFFVPFSSLFIMWIDSQTVC